MWQWVLGIAIALLLLWGVVSLLVWLFAMHPAAPFTLISACCAWQTFVRARAMNSPAPLVMHLAIFALCLLGVFFVLHQPLVTGDGVLDFLTLGWFVFMALATAAAIGWRKTTLPRVQVVAIGLAVLSLSAASAYHYVAFPRGPQTPPVWAATQGVVAPVISASMREMGFDGVDVIVAFYVDRRGRPRYARVIDNPSGDDSIAEAALNALNQSVFTPIGADGKRGYWANVSMRFDLRGVS